MTRALLVAFISCLSVVSPLRAETMRIELKYVAVEDILEQIVRDMSELKTDKKIEALVKKGKARIKGAKVVINPQMNNMRLEGEAEALKRVWDFVETVDVRPTQVHLKGLFVEVGIDDTFPSAMGLFGKPDPTGTLVLEGEEADLARLEEKVIASPRAAVAKRPQVFTATNKDAHLALGLIDDTTFKGTVGARVHSDGEVTLSVELNGQFGDQTSQLRTTVRLGDGNVVVLGGNVMEDAEGNRKEMLLLLQSEILKGATEEEKTGPFGR